MILNMIFEVASGNLTELPSPDHFFGLDWEWANVGWFLLAAYMVTLVVWHVFLLLRAAHRILYPYFIAPLFCQSSKILHHCQPGEWAVVTGATDGIGKAYAKEFASYGNNVVLISRTPARLQRTKEEMEEDFPDIRVGTIVFDFAAANFEDYDVVRRQLDGLNIGALVNCVGATYDELGPVGTVPEGDRLASEFLRINCLSATIMTRMLIEDMVSRGRGAIVNVCSVAGIFPVPFLAMYGACKAYVGHLTRAMQLEYSGTGVRLQAVYPFFVDTKMGRMRRSWTVPSPQLYARQALQSFGTQDHSFGCFSHSAQGEGLGLLWSWISDCLLRSSVYDLMIRQQRKKFKRLNAKLSQD